MIRGHVALVRHLREFMERSGLPWGAVEFKYEIDEDGRPKLDDGRAEMAFSHRGRNIEIAIFAPAEVVVRGQEPLPLGRLSARCRGQLVKGPIDQTTWDRIVALIDN